MRLTLDGAFAVGRIPLPLDGTFAVGFGFWLLDPNALASGMEHWFLGRCVCRWVVRLPLGECICRWMVCLPLNGAFAVGS